VRYHCSVHGYIDTKCTYAYLHIHTHKYQRTHIQIFQISRRTLLRSTCGLEVLSLTLFLRLLACRCRPGIVWCGRRCTWRCLWRGPFTERFLSTNRTACTLSIRYLKFHCYVICRSELTLLCLALTVSWPYFALCVGHFRWIQLAQERDSDSDWERRRWRPDGILVGKDWK
jgi:hypothetical protein